MSEAPKKRWYVVQAFSGFEGRVATSLREHIKLHNMEDLFGEVMVPTEEVVEIRGGQRRKSERKFFPGYVLVQIEGRAGENVGVLLRGIKREEIERGQVLAKPGTIKPHTKFESEVYILSKDEGGRHTPFFKGYRPQFYFRTTDVTGTIELPEGVEMVMPGDNIKMVVTLIHPIAMDDGLRFAIREGGRTVGAGVVAKVLS